MAGLVEFLKRVAPRMTANLEKNEKSQIFKGYEANWTDDATKETEILHKLVNPFDFLGANQAVQANIEK